MRSEQFCVFTTTESRAKTWRQLNAFKHRPTTVAKAAVRSKVVVLLSLIYCLMYFPLFVGVLCLSLF